MTLSFVACGDDESPGAAGTATTATAGERTDTDAPAEGHAEREAPRTGGRSASDAIDAGSGPPSGSTAKDDGRPVPTEARRVDAVVTGMYDDMTDGDAAGVCAAMSKVVRRQIAQNVVGGSTQTPEDRTCEESFSKFLDAASGSGLLEQTLDADVVDVDVDGRQATATVSLSGKAGEVRLVKEEGEWRFGASPLGGSR
ncbi:MAG TPA: hypothetical protein VHF88_02480 [Thermoleophilaceae bacterium]|nr:hypothetical protein [Thermoleophilaceae bacterium]